MDGSLDHMQRALAEAVRGTGRTHPNPMVGCVIVRGNKIVATGYHKKAGGAHAEAAALKAAGSKARGADLYVTLEPCNHQGRTPPCTEAIIAAGIRRVFVGMKDPHPLVDGRGIRRLRKAGIEVEVGLLRDACLALNEAYVHHVKNGRPFVMAKLAQSIDGRVATRTGESKWITSPQARRYGHGLRKSADAIVVGIGTVLADDPTLTCRVRGGVDPVRVVIDSSARTPLDANIIRIAQKSKAPTWILVGDRAPVRRVANLERAGARVLRLATHSGRVRLEDVIAFLGEEQLMSVLVEGGPTLMGGFFDAGLVDKVYACVAPVVIGGADALSSVGGQGVASLADATNLCQVSVEQLGPDLLVTGYCS